MPLSPSPRLARLWLPALIVAGTGAAILYDATPGINFVIWTGAAIAGLLYVRNGIAPLPTHVLLPVAFALVLAAGAAITAEPLYVFFIVLLVASLLGLTTLLAATSPAPDEYGPLYILTAPFRALGRTLLGSIRTCVTTLDALGTARWHPALRGVIIAAPVVILFAVMFASADPVFARGRDAVAAVFSSWDFLPRLIFWSLLSLFLLGAYAVAASGATSGTREVAAGTPGAPERRPRVSLAERVIVLGAAAAVSWLFVLLQIAYLFGNPAAVAGSGVTFAEYARRGFAELAVVATVAVALIVSAAESGSAPEPAGSVADRKLRVTALVLLAAVGGVLLSAAHRVVLYEAAYGYTTARLHAQAYIGMTLVVLLLVAREVVGHFSTPRLARWVMAVALTTFAVLILWNNQAWIARRNLERFASTGRLDTRYLSTALSPDAYPTLIGALPTLAEPVRTQLADGLRRRGPHQLRRGTAWYEWNLRRRDARNALASLNRLRTGTARPPYPAPAPHPAAPLAGIAATPEFP